MHVPLFPLNAVLFPGGPLPLRIFEPRYLSMVSHCMQTDSPFGVLLIRDGNETGLSTTHHVGTLARITDWYQGSDGLLGITAIGEERFRLISTTRQDDGLNIGEFKFSRMSRPCRCRRSTRKWQASWPAYSKTSDALRVARKALRRRQLGDISLCRDTAHRSGRKTALS